MDKITIEDFTKLDLRVVEVTEAYRIPDKSKIMVAKVDLGEDNTREVVVGGGEYYEPEFFIGKKMILLANLQPKRIAGIMSQGMLLAADVEGKPYWLQVEDNRVPTGSKIH